MKLRKCFRIAGATTKMLSRDCSQTSTDSKRRHTLLVDELANLKPVLDRRGDNEFHPEIPADANAETKEMKLAVLSWEQRDISRSHGDASDGDDC